MSTEPDERTPEEVAEQEWNVFITALFEQAERAGREVGDMRELDRGRKQ